VFHRAKGEAKNGQQVESVSWLVELFTWFHFSLQRLLQIFWETMMQQYWDW
jgi:hypothetical protein